METSGASAPLFLFLEAAMRSIAALLAVLTSVAVAPVAAQPAAIALNHSLGQCDSATRQRRATHVCERIYEEFRMPKMTLMSMLLALTLVAGELHAASTEHLDVEERVLARLAREKLRQSMDKDRDSRNDDLGGSSSGCSLNIGNVVNKKRIGGKTEINVIVTGPVVQANKNCR